MFIFFTFIVSLLGLIWSASHLIIGASGLANEYRISSLLMGITILALGITIPQIYFAITASHSTVMKLVISNTIGLNIANIGLILGIIILIHPPKIPSPLLHHGYPLLFLAMLITYSMIINKYLTITDGSLLLLGSMTLTYYIAFITKKTKSDCPHIKSFRTSIHNKRSKRHNIISLLIGFIVIAISAHYLTNSFVLIAEWFNVSATIIQLTIVATCLCLPQITTCIIAIIRGQESLAIGTIIGSNIYVIITLLAIPKMIHTFITPTYIIWRNIPIIFALTCVVLLIRYNSKRRVLRWQGGLLLLIYCCYVIPKFFQNAVF